MGSGPIRACIGAARFSTAWFPADSGQEYSKTIVWRWPWHWRKVSQRILPILSLGMTNSRNNNCFSRMTKQKRKKPRSGILGGQAEHLQSNRSWIDVPDALISMITFMLSTEICLWCILLMDKLMANLSLNLTFWMQSSTTGPVPLTFQDGHVDLRHGVIHGMCCRWITAANTLRPSWLLAVSLFSSGR